MEMLDLYELIRDVYCKGSMLDTIEVVNDLLEQLIVKPKRVTCELEEILEEDCLAVGICPLCGEVLESMSVGNELVEYEGVLCREMMNVIQCSDEGCIYMRGNE